MKVRGARMEKTWQKRASKVLCFTWSACPSWRTAGKRCRLIVIFGGRGGQKSVGEPGPLRPWQRCIEEHWALPL